MAERNRARARSGYRRARRLRSDRRGVVAVVGTLLALLVFFALFGIFLTQYVPLWMEENESQLSNQLQTSISTLKSGIDDQYLLGSIPSYSVPFQVSSDSVPLLAQPTQATLSFLKGCPDGFYVTNSSPVNIGSCDFERMTFTTGTGGSGSENHPYNQTAATNYLDISVPNRYFTPVDYFFENDGFAAAQSSGREWMVVPPPFNVSRTTGNLSVQGSLLVLLGNESTYTGIGSKDLTSHLSARSNVSSVGRFLSTTGLPRSFNVTLTIGVHDVCAWYNFLYNETKSAFGGLTSTSLWKLTGKGSSGAVALPPTINVCETSITESYDLTLTIYNVNYAVSFIAESAIDFNAGGL